MVKYPIIPEHELLISFARKYITKNKISEFPQNATVDWEYLIKAARYHRVIPFLYSQITSSSEITVPPPFLEELKRSFLRIIQFNMFTTSELISLYNKITAEGIPIIPYKGPILAQIFYGDIKCRQYDDLDILIQKENIQKVKKILLQEGYQFGQLMTPSQEKQFTKSQHHYQFSHPSSGFHIELHWEVSPRIYSFNLDLGKVWERANYITFSGREVLSLSGEDMILIFCEHGTRHYWKRLSMVCDIAKLIELNELDWDYLFNTAKHIGSERVLL